MGELRQFPHWRVRNAGAEPSSGIAVGTGATIRRLEPARARRLAHELRRVEWRPLVRIRLFGRVFELQRAYP